jgi:RHS repeat-associated protein
MAISRNDTRRSSVAYSLAFVVSLVSSVGWSTLAAADYKYTYTGHPFTTFFGQGQCLDGGGECMLSGSFTLTTPVPPNIIANTGHAIDVGCELTDFSLTDGVNVINLDNLQRTCPGGGGLGVMATDANGQITSWSFNIGSTIDPACPICNGFTSYNFDAPGVGHVVADDTRGWGLSTCNGCDLALNQDDPGTWTSSQVVDPSVFDGPRNPGITKHCDCPDFGSWASSWVGDPVNALTGNLTDEATDLAVPGRGRSLELDRTYNALDAAAATAPGRFGFGWRDSYATNLVIDPTTGDITVVQAGGATVTFAPTSGGYSAPPYVTANLKAGPGGTYIFTLQNQLTDVFDSTGRLISETDRNGYTTTLSYKSSHLISVADSVARKLAFTTDANGFVTRVTDPKGRVVSYKYDSNGNLSSVIDVSKGVTIYTYDTHHRLLTTTDPRGNTATNVYDASNRVVSQTNALGRTTTWEYGAIISPGNGDGTTTITDPNGNVTMREFINDLLTSLTLGVSGAAPSTWTYTYDAGFNLTSVTDPNGGVWTMTYDSRANLLSRTDPLNRTWRFTYDGLNDPLMDTDPLGVTTAFSYDSNGNLTTVSRPLSGTAQVATATLNYADLTHPGDVTSVTDADGNATTLTYDKYGDVTAQIDPTGNKTTFLYNKIGFTIASVSPRAYVKGGSVTHFKTTYAYNAFGDLTQLRDPLGHVIKRAYDANRNLIGLTDPNGNTSSYSYDGENERTAVTRADGSTVLNAYDGVGHMISQTDGLGHVTQYAYDSENRLVSVTDALGRVTTLGYDLNGNRASRTDPSGRTTTYTYDPANELASIAYADGVTPGVTLAYDADGRRVSMGDGTGTTTYSYDSLHRLTTSVNGAGAAVAYQYDLTGRATSITYPNGQSVTRTFDKAGRVISVTDWMENTTSFTYDPDGNLISQSYPNAWAGAFTFDSADGLLGISYTSGAQKLQFAYLRDKTKLITSEKPTPSRIYVYDSLNRLTSDSATGSYAYDAADRITALNGSTLTYDSGDELLTITGAGATSFHYDQQGNRIAQGSTALEYDQENRLTSFGTTAAYAYNGDGLRMSKTVGAMTTPFTWDARGSSPLLLADGTNSYVYGAMGVLVAQIGPANEVLYYHRDQLANTRMLTDSSGAVQGTYGFDAYGNRTGSTGSAITPFLYAREYSDIESSLSYLRARYYDPATAQFVSRDPVASITREPYAYADDDPANEVDPSGMWPPWMVALYNKLFPQCATNIQGGQLGNMDEIQKQNAIARHAFDPANYANDAARKQEMYNQGQQAIVNLGTGVATAGVPGPKGLPWWAWNRVSNQLQNWLNTLVGGSSNVPAPSAPASPNASSSSSSAPAPSSDGQ